MNNIVLTKHAIERWELRSNYPNESPLVAVKESKRLGKRHRKRIIPNENHEKGTEYFLNERHQMVFVLRSQVVITCLRVDV